jgi:hypothetical protein
MPQLLRGSNGQQVMSEEMAAQLYAQKLYQGVYLGCVQVVASHELRRREDSDGWKQGAQDAQDANGEDNLDVDRIIRMAKKIAVGAMKELGINMVDPGT